MKIEHIELTNYGPFYGTHQFVFADRGLVLVGGDNQDEPRMDSNGSGKSSIFDALDWCLFGRVPRGDHADSICNDEAKSCRVVVTLRDDSGNTAIVGRARGDKNELMFVDSGVNKTALDTKETQAAIEAYLGVDRDVFHSAVLFSQTDLVRYADSTDAERMETLTKILQLDEIDGLLEIAKSKVVALSSEQTRLRNKLAVQEGVLRNLSSTDHDTQINAWERVRVAELDQLAAMREVQVKAGAVSQSAWANLPTLQADLAKVQAELRAIRDPNSLVVNECGKRAADLDKQVSLAQDSLRRLKLDWQRYQDVLAKPQPICPECNQVVPQIHIVTKVNTLAGQMAEQDLLVAKLLSQLSGVRVELDKSAKEYDAQILSANELRRQKAQIMSDLQGQIGRLGEQKAQAGKAQQAALDLDNLIARRRAELNPYVAQKAANEQKQLEVKKELGVLNTQLQQVDEVLQYLDFWVTGFGPKGLKSYILDSRLQELTDAANEWVKILTGGTIWVQFEAQKQTRGKKLVNSPDIRVCRWNPDGTITERNFRSWSGGEKQRISFAIDFGLSRLIARRAKHSYDLLILDEVFKHLDRSGKEAVMEMLGLLAREKSSVLVVEHDTDFQGSFEHRVIVRKKNRRSTIVEESDGNAENQGSTGNVNLQSGAYQPGSPRRNPVRGA